MHAVEIGNLTKTFGDVRAVDDLTLDVAEGDAWLKKLDLAGCAPRLGCPAPRHQNALRADAAVPVDRAILTAS